VADFQMKKCLR